MMREKYDLLLIGATALAVGIAKANPDRSIVILERNYSVAGEFCNAWHKGDASGYLPKTACAMELKKELLQRNVLTKEDHWLPAVQPVLAYALRQSGADAYFFTTITDIKQKEDSYRVCFNAFGIDHHFLTSAIIDTTATFETAAFWGSPAPSCSLTLNHIDTDRQLHETPCVSAEAGRLEIIYNHKNILLIATEPCIIPTEKRRDLGRLQWLPSAARAHFLEAFDEGAAAVLPTGKLLPTYAATVDDGCYDVIVVGLGTAGAMAAITAKQEGLSVLGIEKLPVCGGTGTAGRVTGYYFGYHGGSYTQIDEAAHQYDSSFIPMARLGADQKIAQLNHALSGCDLRLSASFTEALTEGKRVIGVRWYEKGQCHTAKAKYVIDATAEAAVCVSAGCQMLGGRESDGQFQPYTCVHLKYTDGKLGWGNMDQGRVNQYDPDDLGKGILESFSSAIHLREDYSSREYLGIVPLLGLREGRRILGEETVSFRDLIRGRFHQKPVYYCWSNFDNHGKDNALESRDYEDWAVLSGLWGWGLSIPIPMGALIPKGIQGLLAAGRCISVDHDAAFAVRMRDDTSKSGEVAAKLAAMSIGKGIPANEVNVDALRETLFATGCLKPEDETPRLEMQRMGRLFEGQLWCENEEDLKTGLASDAPGYYIWSAFLGKKTPLLRELLDAPEENTRFHAALSLALLEDASPKTVETLCRCALRTDGYIPQSGRKYVYPRSVSAIYALGRLGSPLALPALYQLMEEDAIIDAVPFTRSVLLMDREDLRFQYESHALRALCEIAAKNPWCKPEIREKLQAFLDGKRLTVSLVNSPLRADYTDRFQKMLADLG